MTANDQASAASVASEPGRVSSPWATYAEDALAQELREWSASGCACVWDQGRGRYSTICTLCAEADHV